MNKKYILVTGAAGFIGYFTCKRLIVEKNNVIGIDNINMIYYDINLKEARLKEFKKTSEAVNNSFDIYKVDIENSDKLKRNFSLNISKD